MVRFILDPNSPPVLSRAEQERLDAMTDAEIILAAERDRDNPPLTAAELARLRSARLVRRVRGHLGLSQAAFAKAYRIGAGRVRDLEQGRTQADSALVAYLTVIEKEPEAVRRALAG